MNYTRMRYRIKWLLFKRQVKHEAGRWGCLLIHRHLHNRWMRYNIVSFQPRYKCDECGREW